MKVYVASYCQNGYQKDRVKTFVENQGSGIVNLDFSKRRGTYLTDDDCNRDIMARAKQVWVILPGPLYNQFYYGIFLREKLARKLGIKLRYFKINQTGRYVGKAKEVKRRDIHPNQGSSFCTFSEWLKLWRKKT